MSLKRRMKTLSKKMTSERRAVVSVLNIKSTHCYAMYECQFVRRYHLNSGMFWVSVGDFGGGV